MREREVDDGDGIGVVGEEMRDEWTVDGGGEDGEGEVRETTAEETEEVEKWNCVAFCHEWEENNMMRRLGIFRGN